MAVPLEFADERLTTVVATRQMRESGRKGRRQRAVVDQVAAVAILQGWLDGRGETAPGTPGCRGASAATCASGYAPAL